MADTVPDVSIEWASKHIEKFGDTNVLPVPFEYEAIRAGWNPIKAYLTGIDLDGFERRASPVRQVRAHRRFLVPKPVSGFRIVHQLDPLDSLLYTGAVHEIAETVEASRMPVERRVACSYRINIDGQGRFFADDNGWHDFQERSLEESDSCSHVLLADIADFYNQLNQHRIANALEQAAVDPPRARNIEGFLNRLAAKHSRGLPVGPFASIILAEASLNDVDQFLLRKGFVHTRYVDDFRIFGESNRKCLNAQRELTDYLYTAHRLCLQSSKTKIRTKKAFVDRELEEPERVEQEQKLGRLQELIDAIWEATGYVVELDNLPESEINDAVRTTLREMFETFLSEKGMRAGPVRYILRRAASMRTRIIHELVLEHLDRLTPWFRDVAIYLIATMPGEEVRCRPIGQRLLEFSDSSDIGDLPFIRWWILEILLQKPKTFDPEALIAFVEASREQLGIRGRALVARATGDVAWVRSTKENWQATGPWDQRAILWAGAVLPRDERTAWLSSVAEDADPLISAVARHAMDGC